MKLVLDLARTLFIRLAILLLAALAFVAVDAYRASEAELQRALQKLESTRDDLLKSRMNLAAMIGEARRELASIDDKMQWWRTPRPPPGILIGGATAYMARWAIEHVQALEALEKKRADLEASVARMSDAVSNLDLRIVEITEQRIAAMARAELEGRWGDLFKADFVRRSLWTHRTVLALIFLGLFFGPVSVRAIGFYGLAPLARRATPITLNAATAAQSDRAVAYGDPKKEIRIDLGPGDRLLVKPGWYSLNTEGATRTRFFWDATRPFASYAMGLVQMTEFAPDGRSPRQIRIGAEDDPNHDIIEVRLQDHPGYVVKHGHVVATAGDGLRIEKRWRLWDWRSWLYGSLRYVYFAGTGALYVHGYGAVSVDTPAGTSDRIRERHVIGFDTRASFRIVRTETFVGYWLSDRPLYDISFVGDGSFLQQQSFGRRDERIFRSLLEDLLGAIGKLLGF